MKGNRSFRKGAQAPGADIGRVTVAAQTGQRHFRLGRGCCKTETVRNRPHTERMAAMRYWLAGWASCGQDAVMSCKPAQLWRRCEEEQSKISKPWRSPVGCWCGNPINLILLRTLALLPGGLSSSKETTRSQGMRHGARRG